MKHVSRTGARLQQLGALTAIPFVLLTGPAVGYYLGAAADRRWGFAPWGLALGIAMGLVAGARVTIELIRKSSEQAHHV